MPTQKRRGQVFHYHISRKGEGFTEQNLADPADRNGAERRASTELLQTTKLWGQVFDYHISRKGKGFTEQNFANLADRNGAERRASTEALEI